ncbi:MAG: tetratricopeptide repeat protein [Candidatus Acidiferrales bacterium]
MAFNKSKALENALKFLNQGKVAQAIGEYQLILRADAKDQATLMTVGDLFARQGDMTQAIEYFERLAQVYLNDGFNSKAIAIYKKIAKLAPNELAPLERLADLYVQQGVLSEARPLFLQIAEAHLKANHAQKAVEVLHRLLEVEPENQRVQMRLAELYGVMGQKKEAALTYHAYALRLFERGEMDEAEKLADRALEVDPGNAPAILLKAKALFAASKIDQAIAILGKHPEAEAGGDVTNLLVDYELRAGHAEQAAERARRQLARGHEHCTLLHKVAETMIESGQPEQALPLLAELRGPMTEAGAQDGYLKALSSACERLPGRTEPLETLADFCRTTSDPFRLNGALQQLSDAYAAQGNFQRAEELLVELVDRNKNDERLVERLNQLRAKAGGSSLSAADIETIHISSASEPAPAASLLEEERKLAPAAQPTILEEAIDEETQRYIAQALTDVDLFSSYGLTQKATHLLENVLQRAPRHTPTLERLLDLHLGAGNDRRTAELSAQLEQIHRERNDHVNADRFSELRQRYSKVAGLTAEDMPSAPAITTPPASADVPAAAPVPTFGSETTAAQASVAVPTEPPPFEIAATPPPAETPAAASAPIEFEIPLTELEADTPVDEGAVAPIAATEAPAPEAAAEVSIAAEPAPVAAGTSGEELDLSDEWEAISAEVHEVPAAAAEEPVAAQVELDPVLAPEQTAGEPKTIEAAAPSSPVEETVVHADAEPDYDAKVEHFEIDANTAQAELSAHAPPAEESSLDALLAETSAEAEPEPAIEIVEEAAEPAAGPVSSAEAETEALPAALVEFLNEPAPEVAAEGAPSSNEIELELTPEPVATRESAPPATTDDFISELVAELDDLEGPAAPNVPEPALAASPDETHVHLQEVFAQTKLPPMEPIVPAAVAGASNGTANGAGTTSPETLNELAEVFQEFRAELGEMGEEDEDLETHYNLGIAYREMGLLDEAIGEFQKVAKAVQKGKPFQYEMNCSTMLGLSFMDKGEPKVASLWYQRALQVPGLEEESILALRYDLAMALESAGESGAALDSFRQVYAANIDYRDVADRIATLQKH